MKRTNDRGGSVPPIYLVTDNEDRPEVQRPEDWRPAAPRRWQVVPGSQRWVGFRQRNGMWASPNYAVPMERRSVNALTTWVLTRDPTLFLADLEDVFLAHLNSGFEEDPIYQAVYFMEVRRG